MGEEKYEEKLQKLYQTPEISIFGSNSNGLQGKLDSLKSSLEFFRKPSCVNIQETKLRSKGTVELERISSF